MRQLNSQELKMIHGGISELILMTLALSGLAIYGWCSYVCALGKFSLSHEEHNH